MNIEKEIAIRRENNLRALHAHVRSVSTFEELSRDVKEKVRNYLTKHNFPQTPSDLSKFLGCMKYNIHTLTHFVKEPGRQSAHQEIVYNHMRDTLTQPIVQTSIESSGEIITQTFPANMKPRSPQQNADLFLTPNGIFNGSTLKGNKTTKSIDFMFESEHYWYAGTHKYTHAEGGAQDNQFKDAKNFLSHAPLSHIDYEGKPLFILAILDGEYYKSRFAALRKSYPHDWFIIGDHEEVLAQILKKEVQARFTNSMGAPNTTGKTSYQFLSTISDITNTAEGTGEQRLTVGNKENGENMSSQAEGSTEVYGVEEDFKPIGETFQY